MANPNVGKSKKTYEAALAAFVADQVNRVRFAAYEIGIMLEDYARANHKWYPITSMTDNTTGSTVAETADTIFIWLSSGSDHAKYLELARSGKWAWLRPAVMNNRDNINAILRKHLGAGVKVSATEFSSEGDF